MTPYDEEFFRLDSQLHSQANEDDDLTLEEFADCLGDVLAQFAGSFTRSDIALLKEMGIRQ